VCLEGAPQASQPERPTGRGRRPAAPAAATAGVAYGASGRCNAPARRRSAPAGAARGRAGERTAPAYRRRRCRTTAPRARVRRPRAMPHFPSTARQPWQRRKAGRGRACFWSASGGRSGSCAHDRALVLLDAPLPPAGHLPMALEHRGPQATRPVVSEGAARPARHARARTRGQ